MRISRTVSALLAGVSLASSSFAVAGDKKEPVKAAEVAQPKAAEVAPVVKEGTGEAAIENNNKEAAKKSAINKALRDILEQTMGTYIAADTQTKDFMLLKDQVYSSVQGYVSSYEVLEEKENNGAIKVKVKAVVANQKINEDAAAMGLLIRAMKSPKIALLVSEQAIKSVGDGKETLLINKKLTETEIIKSWKDVGVRFIDLKVLSGKMKIDSAVISTLSPQQAVEIGNLTGADIIVTGVSVLTRSDGLDTLVKQINGDKPVTDEIKQFQKSMNESAKDSNMGTCKATVTLTAINSDDGDILATDVVNKSDYCISVEQKLERLFTETSKEVSQKIQMQLLTEWNKRTMGGSHIKFVLKNVPSFSSVTDLTTALSSGYKGVQGVDQKGFNDGAIEFDVMADGGDANSLAATFEKGIGTYKIRIKNVSSNTITAEVVK